MTEYDVFKQAFSAVFLAALMFWGIVYGAKRIDRDAADWGAYPWVVCPMAVALLIFAV